MHFLFIITIKCFLKILLLAYNLRKVVLLSITILWSYLAHVFVHIRQQLRVIHCLAKVARLEGWWFAYQLGLKLRNFIGVREVRVDVGTAQFADINFVLELLPKGMNKPGGLLVNNIVGNVFNEILFVHKALHLPLLVLQSQPLLAELCLVLFRLGHVVHFRLHTFSQ